MIPVEIHINRRILGKKTIRRFLPQSYQEAGEDALFCIRQLLLYKNVNLARAKALAKLLYIRPHLVKGLTNNDLGSLVNLLSWMNLEPSPAPAIRFFDHKGKRYWLPKEKFADGLAIEYPIADEYFTQLLSGDDDALIKLVATMARPKKDGKRIPLTSREEVEKRADELKDLSPEAQWAVYMYFGGVKQYIHNLYKGHLFKANEAEEGQQDSEAAMFGWWGIYMDVAESGVFGNLEKVYQSNFHNICTYLVKKKQEAERLKKFNPNTKEL